MDFYNKVKDLCEKNGHSVTALADKLPGQPINRSAIHNWKTGAKPRPATVKAIADYFGVSIAYLTGEDDAPAPVAAPAPSAPGLTAEQQALLDLFARMSVLQRAQLLVYASDLLQGGK